MRHIFLKIEPMTCDIVMGTGTLTTIFTWDRVMWVMGSAQWGQVPVCIKAMEAGVGQMAIQPWFPGFCLCNMMY